MPSIDIFASFLIATALFAYMPGPAMLYAIAQTLAGGKWRGLSAALGIHLGGYVHVIAAAAGLSFLFDRIPQMYLLLKIAGAVYLVYLGCRIIFSRQNSAAIPEVRVTTIKKRAFVESVFVEVLNPKTALFFVAFLPQFVDSAAAWPIPIQFLVLGTIVNVMFSSADILCIALAEKLSVSMRQSSVAQHALRGIGGCILIGLGIRLGFDTEV